MKTVLFVLAGLSLALGASWKDLYSPTPIGYMLKTCIHRVPSGSVVGHVLDAAGERTGAMRVSHESFAAGSTVIPRCDTSARPMLLTKEAAAAAPASSDPFPPDYDGWLAYTVYNISHSFDTFNGNFTVPDQPQNDPDILYLFTGLQNVDWIPKVDPEVPGFDIIQPVLQYPADEGYGWSVKSWYVTVDAGYLVSDEIQVNAGDYIYGVMQRTGVDSWYIGSTVGSTGQTTSITATETRLTSQPWAYNTLECYGCQDCTTFPKTPIHFVAIDLQSQGKSISADWKVTPKHPEQNFCKEKATVLSSVAVDISFQ